MLAGVAASVASVVAIVGELAWAAADAGAACRSAMCCSP
jgi:hypothetical protein